MFQNNNKQYLLKEEPNKLLWLIYDDYHKEYQIIGFGGFVQATISITPTFNAREVALELFDNINKQLE